MIVLGLAGPEQLTGATLFEKLSQANVLDPDLCWMFPATHLSLGQHLVYRDQLISQPLSHSGVCVTVLPPRLHADSLSLRIMGRAAGGRRVEGVAAVLEDATDTRRSSA